MLGIKAISVMPKTLTHDYLPSNDIGILVLAGEGLHSPYKQD
jgi:hypothetical protein